MALVDSTGRLFGKINVFDAMVIGILALTAVGIIAVQSGFHVTSGQVVKGETDIEYTFLMHNAKTLRPDMLKPGQFLSMTIRNQPRGKVEITKVEVTPRKAVIPSGNGQYKLVDDPADLYGYEYLVTVKDKAVVTDEGFVTEGVKVKIGMGIDVEGFDYRFNGTIINVTDMKHPENTPAKTKPASAS